MDFELCSPDILPHTTVVDHCTFGYNLLNYSPTAMIRLRFYHLLIICFLLLFSVPVGAQQQDSLQLKLHRIAKAFPATIGFSVLDIESGKTYSFNGNRRLPMQSVYKFHLALAVLNQVDQGKLSLDGMILLNKSNLLPNTHSPLRDKYPGGNVKITLSELLTYTVGQSDNNGCDILFRLLGGTLHVDAYIKSLGIDHVAIVGTEEEMHQDSTVQFKNWTTSNAAVQLLALFYQKKILSQESHNFLWKVMTESPSGPNKIKGKLPARTPVAHKTGYSGVNEIGVTTASNDIGIVTMPNGKHFAVAAFVGMTKQDEKAIDAVIAELTSITLNELNR